LGTADDDGFLERDGAETGAELEPSEPSRRSLPRT